MKYRFVTAFLAFSLSVQWAAAAAFSFSGNFTEDDNIQLINFSLLSASSVTLRTYSYAGGQNSAGVVVPNGGFDTNLALFNSAGTLLRQNDDGTCAQVGADPSTGQCYDSFLRLSLAPGAYTLALTESDNYAIGPALTNGFYEAGQGNFTAADFGPPGATGGFYDLYSNQRTSAWEVDLRNVNSAALVASTPEPAALALVIFSGVCLLGLTFRQRRRSEASIG